MGKFNRRIATLLACVSGISSIGVNFNSMAMKEQSTVESENNQQGKKYLLFGEKEYKDLINEFRDEEDEEDKNASEESILTRNNVFRDDDGRIVYSIQMLEYDDANKDANYKLTVNGKKSPVYNNFQRHPVLDKIDELTNVGCKVYKMPCNINRNLLQLFVYTNGDLCRLWFDASTNSVSCVPLGWKKFPSLGSYLFQANSFENLPLVSDNKQMLHEIRMTGRFSEYKPGSLDYMEEYPDRTCVLSLVLLMSMGFGINASVKFLKDQANQNLDNTYNYF